MPAPPAHPSPTRPRIACIQWLLRECTLDSLLQQLEQHIRQQACHGVDLVIFPELFALGLLDKQLPGPAALRQLASHSDTIIGRCNELAQHYQVNVLAGSLPMLEQQQLFNVASFCHRDGRPVDRQYKLHPTPYEKKEWQLQGGDSLAAFDTDIGRCGMLVCYDVEFPELSRLLAQQGMDLLLVPFWTDSINAYHRVRYCAQARAIENECYVAVAGCVGSVPGNEVIDFQHAASAIFSPSDFPFPEQAVLAEAPANVATCVVTELEMEKLYTLRQSGSVQTGRDCRRDLYEIRWHGQPFIRYLALRGEEIIPHLQDIAELRIRVFREFPYLYDGSLEYEMNYLRAYVNSPRSLVFLIKEGNRSIGATTALPLTDADAEFHAPFIQHNIALEDVYYFGESVLLPEYRGRQFGHRFFDEREARAAQLGFPVMAFCAVVRDAQHPHRPEHYIPHDAFWSKRGYTRAEGFTCAYHWKDIDEAQPTDKLMQFWIKQTNSPSQTGH